MATPSLFSLVKIVRPKQWLKNGFVLAPLIFTGSLTNMDALKNTLLVALMFCLASSAAYILNDYVDYQHDLKHPIKSRTRPLATGEVSKLAALILLAILYAALIAGYFLQPAATMIIAAYLLLNLAYTFALKHIVIIDIFTIALGFVLRVYAGAAVISVPVSAWLLVTTMSLAIYLAAIKRRQELANFGPGSRKALKNYSIPLINRYAEIASTSSLVFYSLFVTTTRQELIVTIPVVLFGMFRYWYIVETMNKGEAPDEIVFSDWPLILTVALWMTLCILLLY